MAYTTTSTYYIEANVKASGSINAPQGFIGPLFGTASYSATASYANPLNQILFITGSLNIFNPTTNDSLIITSGSTNVLTVTGSGVTVFGTINPPQAYAGGIYYDGTDFFLGF